MNYGLYSFRYLQIEVPDSSSLQLQTRNVAVLEVLVEHERADEDDEEQQDGEHDAVPSDRVRAADRVDQVTVAAGARSTRVLGLRTTASLERHTYCTSVSSFQLALEAAEEERGAHYSQQHQQERWLLLPFWCLSGSFENAHILYSPIVLIIIKRLISSRS